MRNRPSLKEWHNALFEIYKNKPRSKNSYIIEAIAYLVMACTLTALVTWMALTTISRSGHIFPWYLLITYTIATITGWIRFFITLKNMRQ